MLSMVGFGCIQIIIQLPTVATIQASTSHVYFSRQIIIQFYNSTMIYKVLYLMETLYYRGVTINGHNLYCLFGWLS